VNRRTNLYYAQTTDLGKSWTTAAGDSLTLPLSQVNNPARVLDLEAQNRLIYTCDLNFDSDGNPVLLYVTSKGAQPGPSGDPRQFQVTHWTGSKWNTHTVAPASHNYNMGSLYISANNWRVIAPTEIGPQRFGAGGEIAVWLSSDQGQTWLKERQVTRDSVFNHNYVRRPLHAKDPFSAFWVDGNSDQISESHLYFCDSTGTRIRRLPYSMTTDDAEPESYSGSPKRPQE